MEKIFITIILLILTSCTLQIGPDCEKHNEGTFGQYDVDNCYMNYAVENKDLKTIEKIVTPFKKDGAYLHYAFVYNETSFFCDNIIDSNYKNHCLALTTKNTSHCQNINTDEYSFKHSCEQLHR